MQKYVNQLIEDIRNAHRAEEENPTNPGEHLDGMEEDEDISEHFEEVERYLNSDGEMEPTFAEHCGLNKVAFPPADRLSDQQKIDICAAFEKMMESYNAYPTMPDVLPTNIAYETLVGVLDVRLFLPKLGMVGIEFCDYEPEKCQFGEYCTCKEFEDEFELPEEEFDFEDIELTEEEEKEFKEEYERRKRDRDNSSSIESDDDLPF